MKILINCLKLLLLMPLSLFAANPQMPITNGTGCLENPDFTVSYTKPVTIYVFVNQNGNLTYSGVSVAPGQQGVEVPMSPAKNISPSTYAVYLGTNPHDAPPHITMNVPAGIADRLVDQSFNNIKENGCGNPNYPCVGFASVSTEQCYTLLAKHPQM